MNPKNVFPSLLKLLMATSCAVAALPALSADNPLKRGDYLVKTGNCNDCHTPWKMGQQGPEPDMSRELSGHPQDLKMPPPPALPPGPWIGLASVTNTAWAGPWGVSFTANLTPDKETGLGTWNERTFIDAIRTGRHMGKGRPILPPMPVSSYQNYTDADLGAIFAYLRSIKPIANEVPDPLPPMGAPPSPQATEAKQKQ